MVRRILLFAALCAAGVYAGTAMANVPYAGWCGSNWQCVWANPCIQPDNFGQDCDFCNPPAPPGSVPSCTPPPPDPGCVYYRPYGCPCALVGSGLLSFGEWLGCR